MPMKHANNVILLFFILFIGAPLFAQYSDSTVITLKATYYADRFVGRKTSTGEIFSHDKLTAAHKTIKLGTYVEVTNPNNGKKVIVRVNDRCPITGILDMTRRGLKELGIKGTGAVTVKILGTNYTPAKDTVKTNFDEEYAIAKTNKRSKPVKERKKTLTPPKDKPVEHVQNKAKEQTTTSKQNPQTDRHTKYNIELNTVRSEEVALQEISLLPDIYKDKITLQHKGRNIHIILNVDMDQNQIESLLNELIISFPRAIIIQQ